MLRFLPGYQGGSPRAAAAAPGSCDAPGLEVVGKVFRGGEKSAVESNT